MTGIQQKIQRLFKRDDPPHHHHLSTVEMKDVSVRYGSHTALSGVNLQIERGERVALIGPNGAGKTTLFKLIVGLNKPQEGKVRVYGHDPGGHICIGYVPQRNDVDWNFPVTVFDVVMMGRSGRLGLLKKPTSKDRALVEEALELVHMSKYANRQISELSGGQQQRVFLARTFAQEAELLLMDEPFTGLDESTRSEILAVLDTMQQRGITMFVSIHNLKIASTHFPRIVLLQGSILADGSPDEVLKPSLLIEAYGRAPIDSITVAES